MSKDEAKSSKGQTEPESLDDYITRLSLKGNFKEKSVKPGTGYVLTGITSDVDDKAKGKGARRKNVKR